MEPDKLIPTSIWKKEKPRIAMKNFAKEKLGKEAYSAYRA